MDVTPQPSTIPVESRISGLRPSAHSSATATATRRLGTDPSELQDTEVRVKGINFTAALDAILRLHGPSARSRIEKETPSAVGDAMRFGGLVIGGWYSAAWYREFWNSIRDNLGTDPAAVRQIGRCAAEISVNVAYHMLARMTSPQMLLTMSSQAFGYYFQRGSLEVTRPFPNRLTARWRNCNGFNKTIWNVIEGACLYFVEATGAKDVTFSVVSGGETANHMLANATWR